MATIVNERGKGMRFGWRLDSVDIHDGDACIQGTLSVMDPGGQVWEYSGAAWGEALDEAQDAAFAKAVDMSPYRLAETEEDAGPGPEGAD